MHRGIVVAHRMQAFGAILLFMEFQSKLIHCKLIFFSVFLNLNSTYLDARPIDGCVRARSLQPEKRAQYCARDREARHYLLHAASAAAAQ